MQHTFRQAAFPAAEHVQRIAVGIPDVESHGHILLQGKVQLTLQHLPLHIPGGVVVVVIQTDFANAHNLVVFQPLGHLLKVFFPELGSLVGMKAHHAVDLRILIRKAYDLGAGGHIAGGEDAAVHASFRHARQHILHLALKAFVLQMAVGIKQFHHPTMAPSSTPSPTETRRRLSLPSTAERIMPWLSMPIIMRGFRLVMATIWRPTSSSGLG